MKTRFLYVILIYLFTTLCLSAQSSDNQDFKPLWLRMDDGIQMVESGESGEAVYLFRKILEEFPGNPEAEMWLGLIFDKENEYQLAINYLELALEHKKQLVILEEQYQILYKLADINRKVEDISSYLDNLESIIEYSGEGPNDALEAAMLNVLKQRGFDKFIELYRPAARISLKAFGLLGKYYFEKGAWSQALGYLMEVTGAILNTSIEELKSLDPEYSFLIEDSTDTNRDSIANKSLIKLFDQINSYPLLKDYLNKNSFFEYFYYLGKSLVNSGYEDSGSYILEKIYVRPESGKWGAVSNPG